MELLYSPRGKVFGASYTDVVAHLPALNLLILISLFGAVLLLVNIKRRGWLLPVTAISLWLAVSIIVGGLVPAAIQRFRVIPDELNKELPYVENHIDYTRLAYGLDALKKNHLKLHQISIKKIFLIINKQLTILDYGILQFLLKHIVSFKKFEHIMRLMKSM
jgi:uncharacterized membrane protein (UPF0182 family)